MRSIRSLAKPATFVLSAMTALSQPTLAEENRLKAHGFYSFGVTQLSEDTYTNSLGQETDLVYADGEKGDASLFGATWAGFQINAKIFEGTEFVYQVILEADDEATDDFDTRTEWMYLKQDLGAGFNTQIGRIRLPAFMDSEVLYVAQTYPWVKAPVEIYDLLPVNHIDGISVNQRSFAGDWTIDTKVVLWGQSKDDSDGYSLSLDDTYGIAVDAFYEGLQLHAALLMATEIIDINVGAGDVDAIPNGMNQEYEDDLLHAVIGARYDDGTVYTSAEYVNISADKGVVDETEAYNLTFGWYFGDFLPYISYSSTETTNADELADNIDEEYPGQKVATQIADPATCAYLQTIDATPSEFGCTTGPLTSPNIGQVSAPFFIANQTSTSVGLKYNMTPKTAIKAQVQLIGDFDETGGKFNSTNLSNEDYDEVYLYEIAIQGVF